MVRSDLRPGRLIRLFGSRVLPAIFGIFFDAGEPHIDHFAGEQRQWLGLIDVNRGKDGLAGFDDEIAHFDIRAGFGWL